ncbi:MAG TPA: transposase [Gammaproteobacteria bacterium]|nr:transposase [Gammaproteobacteria bacterium]
MEKKTSRAGSRSVVAKGWYSRGYLPHLDAPSALQCITFRLADSLPREKLLELESALRARPRHRRTRARVRTIDRWLDAGMGCCALRHPCLAMRMQRALWHFDGERYRLLAWCVMPNHVHVLIEQLDALPRIVGSWKSYTGRWALAHDVVLGLGIPGKRLWMRDYWDRYIRDQRHLDAVRTYIDRNPVKAGLCRRAEDWPWSSAGFRRGKA